MKKIAETIIDRVVGTCDDMFMIVEDMIVEGELSQEQWDLHEPEILKLVDAEMFRCETCSWNLYTWEMSENAYTCNDCGDK